MNLRSVWIGSSVSVISDYLVNTEVTSSDLCLLVTKKNSLLVNQRFDYITFY